MAPHLRSTGGHYRLLRNKAIDHYMNSAADRYWRRAMFSDQVADRVCIANAQEAAFDDVTYPEFDDSVPF